MQTETTTRRGKRFRDLVLEAKGRIREISQDEFQQWQTAGKSIRILDVREPADFEANHIPGAINIPRGLLELDIDEQVPNQDDIIVAYCGGGSRSALAADTLTTMGYTDVFSLAEGFRGWKARQ